MVVSINNRKEYIGFPSGRIDVLNVVELFIIVRYVIRKYGEVLQGVKVALRLRENKNIVWSVVTRYVIERGYV